MKSALRRIAVLAGLTIVFVAGMVWGKTQPSVTSLPPIVLSGSDLGFRLVGRKGDAVVGSLVVRVNGEWVAAEYAYAIKPLGK